MKIAVAHKAGFCFGVARAVKIAYEIAEENRKNVCTYGMLIHNKDVTDDLESKGIRCIETLTDIPKGYTVIVRAHGISKAEYDYFRANDNDVIDATCPYVEKIHQIVREEYEKGRQIIIIGDKNHPEVMGINGWCENSAFILYNDEDIDTLLCNIDKKELSVVAQTTIRSDIYRKFEQILKKHFTFVEFFDTICKATYERQCAAKELAIDSDIVFVIGGKNSSNTQKLYDVCKEQCEDTYKIENASELINFEKKLKNIIQTKTKIGITAGASTPEWVIKEAKLKMAEITNEMNFAEALEETLKSLNTGDIIKGVVIDTTPTEVQVDINGKYDGIIPIEELTNEPISHPSEVVKVGDELTLFVVHVSDRDGVVKLSKKKVDAEKGMVELEEAFNNKEILKSKVTEIVRGGVVVIAKGVRVFIPASEAAERFTEDLGTLLGNDVSFRIIKMDADRRGRVRVVGSIKNVEREERAKKAEAFWADAAVEKAYTGTVKSLTNFGAFVDLGGVDGLIHISELSNVRIKHPSEVISVGDSIDVFIKELDKENNKVSLVKELKDKKIAEFWAGAEVGKTYTGTVKSVTSFGAFVDLGGVDGLVHISELSWNRIKHPSEVVKVGDTLEVFIKELDKENNKISLGYKKEEESPWYQGTKDLKVDDVIKVKIVRILPFGAFAEIAPFVDGLIHISQISNERIAKPSDALNIGDEVEAKIIEINNETKQIALSIKALLPEAEAVVEEEVSESYTEEGSFTLGDIIDAE